MTDKTDSRLPEKEEEEFNRLIAGSLHSIGDPATFGTSPRQMSQMKIFKTMAMNEPRSLSIWTNNALVFFWYLFAFLGLMPWNLSFRFVTIWFGSSIFNLMGEHQSVYRTLRTMNFVRDAFLSTLPFVLGVLIIEAGLVFFLQAWFFLVSCGIYAGSLVFRWNMCDHPTHRYNMCVEMLCHLVLPPVLGCAIFTPEKISDKAAFYYCFGVDVVLKLGRTVFLMKFEEPVLDDSVPRSTTWARAVSNESFIRAFADFGPGPGQQVESVSHEKAA